MSLITGNLNQITKVPSSQQLLVRAAVWPVISGNGLTVPDQVTLKANPSGFWTVVLELGTYELSAAALNGQVAKVLIAVPDDNNIYSFDQLVVSQLPVPSSPIGGAQPTASPSVLGIVQTDDAVATPIAVTGWFYKADAATARAEITNPANGPGAQNNKVLLVADTGIFYEWDADSVATDDGTDACPILRLADTSALSPGRFVAVTAGFALTGPPVTGGEMIFGTGSPVGLEDAPAKTWYFDTTGIALWLNIGGGVGGWQPITG